MRRLGPAVLLAIAAAATPVAPALSQSGPKAIANGNAAAEIIPTQLSLTQGYQLIFGLVKSINNDSGTVVVAPKSTATRQPFGGATTVGSGPCNTEWCEDETNPSNPDSASYWGPGVYIVTGAPNSTYRVVAGAATATAYWRTPATGRTPALTVQDFTLTTKSSGYTSNIGTLDANGTDTVRVGGTLMVQGGMKTASYRVDVPIQIQYN